MCVCVYVYVCVCVCVCVCLYVGNTYQCLLFIFVVVVVVFISEISVPITEQTKSSSPKYDGGVIDYCGKLLRLGPKHNVVLNVTTWHQFTRPT